MPKEEHEVEKHDSFGMVGISHSQSTGTFLAGSEFKHNHLVTLSIHRSEKHRTLSREWWFAREKIIEIHLSEAQFVEFISRPNMGDGVPCTLDYVNGKRMPNPPIPEPEASKFREDMKADAKKCVEELEAAHAELVEAIESGKVGKTALRNIADKIKYAGLAVSNGIPFVQKSFDEKIEKTIHHAAAEIEATVANMAMRIGVEQMRLEAIKSAPKMIEEGKENDQREI